MEIVDTISGYGMFEYDFISDEFKNLLLIKLRALSPDDEQVDWMAEYVRVYAKRIEGSRKESVPTNKKSEFLVSLLNRAFNRN